MRIRELVPGMVEVGPTSAAVPRDAAAALTAGIRVSMAAYLAGSLGLIALTGAALFMVIGPRPLTFGLLAIAISFTLLVFLGGYFARRPRASAASSSRVLVLTPDGCVIGSHPHVRAFAWSELSGLAAEEIGPHHEAAMVVYGASGERVCVVEGRFLDAPLGFIVAVAEAYRRAAAGA